MYKMRSLKTSDIFKMSKILKKMDLKLDVNDKTTQMEMGVHLIQKLGENLHLAEDEVNAFLSEMVGITPEQFAELPIEDTFEIIKLFKEQKGLSNFLSLAGK
ncbi:hypothetical protein BhaS171_00016 [Bacillus phage vB_BhaS-171]|uniref:hypothetical protein n=1 Tax=Bacillus phage vB_BhaS-171 TaxID=1775140 RepID=UPI0007448FED|nr:hypothetical protein BH781_gp16 [Bacillus phage vB_BhaS-171]ALY08072.1 hypothetical protein BhaS171_00016 [Bacillus phage vB_BhaS-171]